VRGGALFWRVVKLANGRERRSDFCVRATPELARPSFADDQTLMNGRLAGRRARARALARARSLARVYARVTGGNKSWPRNYMQKESESGPFVTHRLYFNERRMRRSCSEAVIDRRRGATSLSARRRRRRRSTSRHK